MDKKRDFTYSFEKLEVWQLSRIFKKKIYLLTQKFPKEERYGLASQLRRCAGSITANLAEGSGRATPKDRAHFTNIAFASALETLDHLITSYDLEYIEESTYRQLRADVNKILGKLGSFYKYQLRSNQNLKDKHLKR